jgi:outer membrane receptor protein involved in Fe transport
MKLIALTGLLCAVAPEALAQAAAPAGAPASAEQSVSPTPPAPGATQTERVEAAGQDAPAPQTQSEAAPTAGGQGVLSYPASFFADSRPTTAMEMIGRLPGFSFSGGDQVRGFGGAAGNVLIDGERPSAKSESLEAIIGRLPASSVERIDLIRGGAPGIDMQGQPVIANIIRRAGAGSTLVVTNVDQFRFDGRVNPQLRLTGTRKAGDLAMDGTVLIYQTESDEGGEGEFRRTDGSGALLQQGPLTNITPVQGIETSGKAELKLGAADTVRASASYKLQDVEQHELATFLTGSEAPGFDRVIYSSIRHDGEVGLDWDRILGPRTTFKLVGLQTLEDRSDVVSADGPDFLAEVEEDTKSGESILRGVLAFQRSNALSFETGAEGAFNFLEGASSLAVNGQVIDLPSADVRVEELRGEAFGTMTWKPSARWSLEAGSRFEVSTITQSGDVAQERSFFFAKPRALLTYAPNPAHQFRLRLEREVGQLDFGDFVSSTQLTTDTVDAGNPDLEPQRTWLIEATYERRFWDKGALVVTYTHGEIEQAVDLIPIFVDENGDGTIDEFFDAPGNIGAGVRDRLELNLTLPLDRLGVPGGLLRTWRVWNTSEVTDPVTGEARRISGQHPYDWELRFSQDLPRWRATYGLDAFGSFQETYYRINEVRRTEIETYYVAFIEHKPTESVSLRGELANFTNRESRNIRTLYDGPRNTAAVAEMESRSRAFSPFIHLRIRKTFGG